MWLCSLRYVELTTLIKKLLHVFIPVTSFLISLSKFLVGTKNLLFFIQHHVFLLLTQKPLLKLLLISFNSLLV